MLRVAKIGPVCYNSFFIAEFPDMKFCPRSSVVEHFFGKEEVKGPIPFVGSRNNKAKNKRGS